MKYKISFIVLFFMKMSVCTVAQVVQPLPTNEQYARSLAHAMIQERQQKDTAKEQHDKKSSSMSVKEILEQWTRVHPGASDEERFRQAAEVLEKEHTAAKAAVDCHKKRFWNFAPGGYQLYENFNKPGGIVHDMLKIFGGAIALFTILIATKPPR